MERTPKRPSAGNHAPGGQLGHLGRELSPAHALGPAVIHHAHHLLRRDRVSGRNREGRFYVYGAVMPAQGIEPRLIGPLALAEHHRPFLGLKWTYQSTCGKWQFLGLK